MFLFIWFVVWWAYSFPVVHVGSDWFIWLILASFDLLFWFVIKLNQISKR